MMNVSPIDPLGRAGKLATLIYLALIVALCLTSTLLLWDTMQRYQASNAALETLARFQNLRRASNSGSNTEGWPAGSPFLEGTTVTLASAALLQRITTAITQAGGSVVSSEVEPQAQRPRDDYVKATATCEVTQVAALQQLLHDLEAGMPFLFVDQLVVEAAPSSDKGERMRVRLAVSGQWRGAK
jgi:general secretion pathway protein M